MVRRGAPEGGDDGVVVRVGVVWVMHCWMVSVVLRGSSGDADVRFTDIPGTGGLKLASMILLRDSAATVVVVVAFIAAYHWGLGRCLSKCYLPLVAHLGGPRVSQDFGAFQGTVAHEAHGSGAGDIFHLLAGRRDVDG